MLFRSSIKDAKKSFRLIEDEAQPAAVNMATDEAIMLSGTPTLRLYSWKPPAISLGYFQSLAQEIDAEKCKELGVDIVRRITGGGAVFHEHELTYSFICSEDYVPKDIIASYELICGAVAAALQSIGVDAKFAPVNDMVVDEKKISGSAQTRKKGMVLQHGTILLRVDIEKMFSLLLVPDEKIKDKMIAAASDRVTSLEELGVSGKDLNRCLVSAFEEAFKTSFAKGELSAREIQEREQLQEKFSSSSWTNMR